MKNMNLYYVYDNINEMAITNIIPAPNDLVAAIGFRDTYINGDENTKKKYPYQSLDLVRFAQFDITEDGEYFINSENNVFDKIFRWQGKEILSFIRDKMIELGVDDNFIEEVKE